MTDLEHDITPVRTQSPRGRVVRVGVAVETNAAAGELEAREQLEPSWYRAALARGAS